MAQARLGCYVHLPFCAHRCEYCAFSTFTDRGHLVESYVEACVADIEATRARHGGVVPETIYLGGGTPSLVPPALLARLLNAAGAPEALEVSVECNPESTTTELLETLAGAGVTRISLGVQSLHAHVLSSLGRRQEIGDVAAAIEAVRRVGFSSYNVDLIYGAAAESDEDFFSSIAGVLEAAPDLPHLSAYALTIEPGTPLSRDPARHPDEDAQARRYLGADARLEAAGLTWYEISNWARAGHECVHNTSCWAGGEYLAFGSAAHGHLGGVRFSNVTSPERYIERIATGRSPVARREALSEDERRLESLELALRTRTGVPLGALDLADPALEGLVSTRGDRIVLTRRGRLLANEVAIRLRAGEGPDRAPWSAAREGKISPTVVEFGPSMA